ncbi:MAG TPA: hypothetical protein K8V15_02010 [Tessaracoccus flavescens]|uniref:CarD-like/TRCF RNAP-interacting domain-containing protein n=1 Tax=Tessaracoccus flavescens TaxID=399497 RepID=A0A921JQ68_9ACTN|nr:hypothetical protein [Tessaracoccus flavescens]
MQLTPGQNLIHPQHGPAVVLGVSQRTVKGNVVDYVSLEICDTGLQVMVPVSKLEVVGIRNVAGRSMLDELAGILTADSGQIETQWARRYKAQRMEVASGDPMRIAAVVRDLLRRHEGKGMSQAERELMREAAAPLVAEIALAVDVTEGKARSVLRSLILEGSTAVFDRLDELEPIAA